MSKPRYMGLILLFFFGLGMHGSPNNWLSVVGALIVSTCYLVRTNQYIAAVAARGNEKTAG